MALPFPAGCFDALTIAFGLRNMADPPAALAEMARVVRPGGRVVILEFGRPANRLWRALFEFYSFRVCRASAASFPVRWPIFTSPARSAASGAGTS